MCHHKPGNCVPSRAHPCTPPPCLHHKCPITSLDGWNGWNCMISVIWSDGRAIEILSDLQLFACRFNDFYVNISAMLIQTRIPYWNLCSSRPMLNTMRKLLTQCVKNGSLDGMLGFNLWTKSSSCLGQKELQGGLSGGTGAASYAGVPCTKIPWRARNSDTRAHDALDSSWFRVSQFSGCCGNTSVCLTQGLKFRITWHNALVPDLRTSVVLVRI